MLPKKLLNLLRALGGAMLGAGLLSKANEIVKQLFVIAMQLQLKMPQNDQGVIGKIQGDGQAVGGGKSSVSRSGHSNNMPRSATVLDQAKADGLRSLLVRR
jgi:hypothetical protein